ncbi:MAG: hypothetical protein IJF40_06045 [Clostridia bacterium]|nr:hypothetical protein [Clostridia bacterium]
MSNRILVPEAAQMLEMGHEELRAWLRSRNPPPFGSYVKEEGKKQGRYIIYRSRVLAYLSAQDMQSA